MLALVLTMLTGFAAGTAAPRDGTRDKGPLKKELFAKEEWYKNHKSEEHIFVGELHRVERRKGGVGRFNPYRLEIEKSKTKNVFQVYAGGKPDLLAPFVGKRVKIAGKYVLIRVEGRTYSEIWPARIEEL